MSIHCYLNSNATLVNVERRTFDNKTKKTKVEQLGKFDITNSKKLPSDMPTEIVEKVQPFINEQLGQIEKAYADNAASGLFGGMPVVARNVRYNSQFRGMKGYREGAAKGRFLGVISGARQIDLCSINRLSNEEIESRMQDSTLGLLGPEIIYNEILEILKQSKTDKDMRGIDCIKPHRAAQLIQVSESIKRFVKLCRADYTQLYNSVRDELDEMIHEISTNPKTAGFGLKRRICDGDVRVNQLQKREETKQLEDRHNQRIHEETEEQKDEKSNNDIPPITCKELDHRDEAVSNPTLARLKNLIETQQKRRGAYCP